MRKHKAGLLVEKNSFVDEGDGLVRFPNRLTIIDGSELLNGLRYEMETLDVSSYKGKLTADHVDKLSNLIGKVMGVSKDAVRVTIDAIQFAVTENPYARLAYNLLKGGYLTDFSVETIGPWPGEDGIRRNSKLVGLSAVVVGNCENATINKVVTNSIKEAKEDGLDTSQIESDLLTEFKVSHNHTNPKEEQEMKYVTLKNNREFAVKVSHKNAAGEEATTELAPGASFDVSEDQREHVENQIKEAKDPAEKKKEENAVDPDAIVNAVNAALDARLKPIAEKVDGLVEADKNRLNKVEEPKFVPQSNGRGGGIGMGGSKSSEWKESIKLQMQCIMSRNSIAAMRKLEEINAKHLEGLQKAGFASNSLNITDVGNFVIPPEMVTEIKGHVSNYRPLLERFQFDETLSLETAWLERTGEFTMDDVDMESNSDGTAGDEDQDLKPIKKPTYQGHQAFLKEFAAVVPVDQSLVRFAAADIVGDLTQMYRRAYDQALARSVIGRLEKAIESNGNFVAYDYTDGDVDGLRSIVKAAKEVAETVDNGVFLMTNATYFQILEQAIGAGPNGLFANLFTTGKQNLFLGRPYVIVPADLMPQLDTSETKSWTFEGVSVTVNHAIIYADPVDFLGRVSGGLNFQVSDVAAYETETGVKSGFQRDKLVFRGFGYRKSAVTATDNVSGVLAPHVS